MDCKALAGLLRLDARAPGPTCHARIAVYKEKVRLRVFLVSERIKLRAKVNAILAYEGDQVAIGPRPAHWEGVEWLYGLSPDPVESTCRLWRA